jgi:hypothetical protein
MNYEHRQVANSILSRLKDGEQFSQSVIRTALRDTGDLATMEARDWINRYRKENQSGWQSRGLRMVAKTLSDLAKRRGLKAVEDLRRRMNEGGKN